MNLDKFIIKFISQDNKNSQISPEKEEGGGFKSYQIPKYITYVQYKSVVLAHESTERLMKQDRKY